MADPLGQTPCNHRLASTDTSTRGGGGGGGGGWGWVGGLQQRGDLITMAVLPHSVVHDAALIASVLSIHK